MTPDSLNDILNEEERENNTSTIVVDLEEESSREINENDTFSEDLSE